MKNKTFLKLAVLNAGAIIATSCGGGGVVKDGKTINVKAYEGGYGTTWLYQLKEKFESVYASEGYKVNIVSTSGGYEGSGILSEMRMRDTGIDVYFVQNVFVDDVTSVDYGICAANLNDVYSSSPIGFNGQEENTTVSEKLADSSKGVVSKGNDYYGYMWANSPCGLISNVAVLNKYGLEIPVTTKEMEKCYTTIMDEGSIKPFAWGGDDAYGYALYGIYPQLGQLMGKTGIAQFMNMQTGDEIVEDDWRNGADRYNDDRIYEALSGIQKIYNTSTSVNGSLTATNMMAHHNLMTGKAAFAIDGDFFYNETKSDYETKLPDIRFNNIPVSSDLGVRLALDGNGEDANKCDEILSSAIRLFDQGKTNAEIKASVSEKFGVTITDEQVASIVEARACFYEKDASIAYISAYSENVDIAKLLLRVASSDDYGHVFNAAANTAFPYCNNNVLTGNAFAEGVSKVINSRGAWGVSNLKTGGLRKKGGIPVFPSYSSDIVLTLVTENRTQEGIKEKVTGLVAANWKKWMANAGYII